MNLKESHCLCLARFSGYYVSLYKKIILQLLSKFSINILEFTHGGERDRDYLMVWAFLEFTYFGGEREINI